MVCESQLSFAHALMAAWGNSYKAGNIVMAVNRVTGYFDASGGVEHPVMIVAGYLSTVQKWNLFEKSWRKILARKEFDVPYFHMKEFAPSTDVFKTWKGDERRRRKFLNLLISAIADHAKAGFACGIKHDTWDAIDSRYPLTESFGCAYALTGRDCVNKMHVWGEQLHSYSRNEIRSVFEAGDKGKGHLLKVVEEAHKPIPIFEPGRPDAKTGHPGTPALQAADFAAWELLKAMLSEKELAPFEEYRVSLQKLSRAVPVSWTQYKEQDFLELLSSMGIWQRT